MHVHAENSGSICSVLADKLSSESQDKPTFGLPSLPDARQTDLDGLLYV